MAPHLAVHAFFAVLLLALAAPAAGASQTPAGLSVSGQASQEFTPDQGRLVLGAITQAPTSAEAARQNAAVMERINVAVKAKLTEHGRLRSVGYQLYPRTEWDNVARRSRRVGYEANHRLEVISRDPQALGAILDAAVAAGANTVSGPAWSLADPAARCRPRPWPTPAPWPPVCSWEPSPPWWWRAASPTSKPWPRPTPWPQPLRRRRPPWSRG